MLRKHAFKVAKNSNGCCNSRNDNRNNNGNNQRLDPGFLHLNLFHCSNLKRIFSLETLWITIRYSHVTLNFTPNVTRLSSCIRVVYKKKYFKFRLYSSFKFGKNFEFENLSELIQKEKTLPMSFFAHFKGVVNIIAQPQQLTLFYALL